jgi:hypothetical protein
MKITIISNNLHTKLPGYQITISIYHHIKLPSTYPNNKLPCQITV